MARQTAGRKECQTSISRGILESYAKWLQAGLVDLFFDWFEMGRYCDLIWRGIQERLKEVFKEWDMNNLNGQQPVQAPTADILLNDKRYSQHLMAAYGTMMTCLRMPAWENKAMLPQRHIDLCLASLAKYHSKTVARLITPSRDLLRSFYGHWQERQRLSKYLPVLGKGNNGLKRVHYEAVEMLMANDPASKITDPDAMNEFYKLMRDMPEVRRYQDHRLEACLRLGFVPAEHGK